ncbi:hypothetical protein BIY23_03970 [Wolbachia pipientis]|uniref:Msp4/OMP-like domain-containing protein n=1 Tax=Wolbachia pipientis TaxID=955 RepID=A0A1E7QJC5_WOLPI|nr:P44/Msp2 family outer membrane protein [Wolbachia pipientis]OEY86446.1 hypothetical protein BIY23_03970 [Wolbachia pipientis]
MMEIKVLGALIPLIFTHACFCACGEQGRDIKGHDIKGRYIVTEPYFKYGYYGQFFNTISLPEIKGHEGNIINDATLKNKLVQNMESQPLAKYQTSYTPPFAAHIALGGRIRGHILELEGMYSLVKTTNINLNNGALILRYKGSSDNQIYGVTINNDRIENVSVIVNYHCYWKIKSFSFCLYAGCGLGGTMIKMYEKSSLRPAGQIKVGLNYRITQDTDLHIGYRYFHVMGNSSKFETYRRASDSGVDGESPPSQQQKVDNPTILSHSFFGTHGMEAGLVIRLHN